MYRSKLLLINELRHPVRENLSQLYEVESLKRSFSDYLAQMSAPEELAGVVIDCEKLGEKDIKQNRQIVETSLEKNVPVLLLNITNPKYLAGIAGLGFKSECLILKKLDGDTLVEVLDLPEREPKLDEGLATVTNNASDFKESKILPVKEQNMDEKGKSFTSSTKSLTSEDFAAFIEKKLLVDEPETQLKANVTEIVKSNPGDLPSGQAKTIYVRINRSSTIRDIQTFNNELTIVVTLLASYNNPPYKYLRVTSLGAGFHPANGGNIHSDSTYNRGFFQSKINVSMASMTNELTTFLTTPRNANNVSNYTTSSEFQVGVDISKNPGFNASYTIGESYSTPVSDFDIQNRSSGSQGSWDFQLSMTKNSIWDMFEEPFLKKARVKGLPNLAKQNLQPICTAVWYAPKTYNGTSQIQLNWSAQYYRCWVTGNWAKYTKHWQRNTFNWGYWENNPWLVNFGDVNPDGGGRSVKTQEAVLT